MIDPVSKQEVTTFGCNIKSCSSAPDLQALVFADYTSILVLYPDGRIEQTERLSWAGTRAIQVDGPNLTGEAYDPMTDRWYDFQVNLLEMTFEGGSYDPRAIG